MKKQTKAYAYASLAVVAWATAASAFKLTLQHVDFLQLLCGASLVSIVALFAVLLIQGKLGLLRQYSRGDYLRSLGLGLLNPFIYYVVLLKAYSVLPAQEAMVLNYTWPIMLVLLSIPLLKQKIGLVSVLAIFVSFGGVVVIATRGEIGSLSFSNPLGAGLALGSAVIWGLFWIGNVRDDRDEVAKLFLSFCFGFPFVLAATAFFSELRLPDLPGLAGMVYVGLFEMGITFVFWLMALRHSQTTARVSNLIHLIPFLSLVVIHIAVGEKILTSTVAGVVLVVGGIALQRYERSSEPEDD